jgi:methionyl-tRNA synthetase
VQAHGWLLVGGEKMSKTKLTGIAPHDLVEPFGSDAVRYFFQREVAFGQDGNFSWEAMVERYNADLANGLATWPAGSRPWSSATATACCPARAGHRRRGRVQDAAERAYADAAAALEEVAYERALAAIWRFVAAANAYISERRPWDLAKVRRRRGPGHHPVHRGRGACGWPPCSPPPG